MPDHRLQILLDEDRYRKVSTEASRRGISVPAVIREAIDALPSSSGRREAAVAAILAADPMPLPTDPHDLRAEVDARQ